ncbi:DUF5334 family protein [Aureimonas sp. OT7]|uniref:DUF5334 family protein n=1 Tax=Aureimonas sp. OT7 TaxID=2816454 RepID=UPI00178006F0|nr:DUF5334 family protein [Aureimonas sp. OT7]QOG05141.1 DUF5334 family protein [Aureimonas sp. OT7]
MLKFLLALTCSIIAFPALAWDGQDASTGESVEIQSGNLVRSGRDIEVYDHATGEYRQVTVESIQRYGSTVEVEVYDYDTGEYRVLEMED